MATDQDDADIPESGGIFTFGKSRFADNLPNKFWIRNDEVKQVACGDEHTVLLAESGRVFVFGDNSYGQLGLGHSKPTNKPTCVKSLKSEQVSVIGCGKSHTLIGTSTGQLFTFGSNSDHQCAVDIGGSQQSPAEVELNKPIVFTQLSGGSSHSVGLDKNGDVYVWGDNSEGQLGLGNDESEAEFPTKLPMNERVTMIDCGYYHTALVTEGGNLYTFGESDGGKLGRTEGLSNDEPTKVNIKEKVIWVSCGGQHTIAVTASGTVYGFGNGQSGQLGLGTNVLESSVPVLISSLEQIKVKKSSCGENFTAVISEKGQMYTFGDGRHGKLALGAENFSNQFRPFRVPRFSKFEVTRVACGGCHTVVLAHKTDSNEVDEEVLDPLNTTFANSLRISTDGPLGNTARDRRRAKETPEPLSRTLPPLTSSARSLPPLNSIQSGKHHSLNAATLPSPLDKRKLPDARFSVDSRKKDDDEEEDSEVSVTPAGSSEEEDEEEEQEQTLSQKRRAMKLQSAKLINGKRQPLPQPAKGELQSLKSKKQSAESEEDEEESDEEEKPQTKTISKKPLPKPNSRKQNEESEDDEEEDEEEENYRSIKKLAEQKNKKSFKKKPASDEDEVDSALEDSEEELNIKNKKGKQTIDRKNNKLKKKIVESKDEDDEKPSSKKKLDANKKSGFKLFGKKSSASMVDSEDEDDEEEEEEKPKKKADKKQKSMKKKTGKEEDDEDEEDEEGGDGDKEKKDEENKDEEATPKKESAEPEKKSKACTIL